MARTKSTTDNNTPKRTLALFMEHQETGYNTKSWSISLRPCSDHLSMHIDTQEYYKSEIEAEKPDFAAIRYAYLELIDFKIEIEVVADTDNWNDGVPVVGIRYSYNDVWRIDDPDTCILMAKLLTKCRKAINTFTNENGAPTPGQWVSILAKTIGATKIVTRREKPLSWSKSEYHWRDVKDAIFTVNHLVNHRKETMTIHHAPKAIEA